MYLFGLAVSFSLALIAFAELEAFIVGAQGSRADALGRAMRYAWPAAERIVQSELARQVASNPSASAFVFTGRTLPACPVMTPGSPACAFAARFDAHQAGTTAQTSAGVAPGSADELSYNVNAHAQEQRVAVELAVRIGPPAEDGAPRSGPLSASVVEKLTYRTFAFAPFASLIAQGAGTAAIVDAGDAVGCGGESTCGDATLLHAYEICTPPSGATGEVLAAALAWCRTSAGGTYVGMTSAGGVILLIDDDRNVRWPNADDAGNSWTP